jgi:lipoyl(octanoyl) transferase
VQGTKKTCWVVNAGVLGYLPAFGLQREVVAARKTGAIPDILVFCEHPHVITLGRNGARANLLAGERALTAMNVEFCETDRGGDITYHGPGQIVGYPLLDLAEHRRDVRWYVEQLEEVMMRTAADYGLAARRIPSKHGTWIDSPGAGEKADEEKLAALGVHLSRWVTSHGFAFNVSTDLRFFDLIVPCGLAGKRATSLERALGRSVSMAEARDRLTAHFAEVFGLVIDEISLEELNDSLARARPAVPAAQGAPID